MLRGVFSILFMYIDYTLLIVVIVFALSPFFFIYIYILNFRSFKRKLFSSCVAWHGMAAWHRI